jgi:hypothetical protein
VSVTSDPASRFAAADERARATSGKSGTELSALTAKIGNARLGE